MALRNGVAEANGNRDVLTRLARQFAQNWCRAALGDPRTQKRIPPIVREVIQPSRHFTVIYNGFFRVLYDVLGELLAAVHGQGAVDEESANSNAYHHECGMGIDFQQRPFFGTRWDGKVTIEIASRRSSRPFRTPSSCRSAWQQSRSAVCRGRLRDAVSAASALPFSGRALLRYRREAAPHRASDRASPRCGRDRRHNTARTEVELGRNGLLKCAQKRLNPDIMAITVCEASTKPLN